jgi:ribosomal protein S18 acetylase RimI-like enzyme
LNSPSRPATPRFYRSVTFGVACRPPGQGAPEARKPSRVRRGEPAVRSASVRDRRGDRQSLTGRRVVEAGIGGSPATGEVPPRRLRVGPANLCSGGHPQRTEAAVPVRRLRAGEEGEIVQAHDLFDEEPDPAAARTYLEDLRNIFLMAYEGTRAVGFLRGTELGQLKGRRRQMFLYEIGVVEGFRRRGIGRELIEVLLRYCRDGDFEEVFVFTDPANEPAVSLYQSTGAVTETPGDRMFVYQLLREGGAAKTEGRPSR